MHTDHFQEGLLVHGVNRRRSDGFGHAGAGQIRLPAHHGGDGGGVVAPLVAVVREAHRHQQRAQVGEPQAQRPEGCEFSPILCVG